MAKVLFIQSFSPKIYELNDLTFNNHIKYFNKHTYSFIFKNETYNSGLFDFKGVVKYLDEFDIVVTLGCDCIITDFDTPIESFASNYISVLQESIFSYYCGTFCNGEILIFNKKDEQIYSIGEKLDFIWKDMSSQQNMHEAQTLKLDISKAREVLGWNPLLSIDETLNKTFEWYRAWMTRKNLERLTEKQIEDYMAMEIR